jgi:hypothetical protein
MATAVMSSIWTLLWAIRSFQDINTSKSDNQNKLATFSLVLGILYIVAFVITFFGVFAAVTQRVAFVRIYTFASTLAVLIVVGAGLLRTVLHFTLKSNLIDECTDLSTGADVSFRYGIWGPTSHTTLNRDDAASWCKNAWNHDSFSEIVSVLIEIVLGTLFSLIAFSYYRQLLDPTSPANAMRAPSNQARTGFGFPQRYNPPYNGGMDGMGGQGYGGSYPYPVSGQYAPPPGPPPTKGGDDAFVPPYDHEQDRDGKLPGYDIGSKTPSYMEGDIKGGDPFADFDGPSQAERERELTASRR